jgi:hypothetical protein
MEHDGALAARDGLIHHVDGCPVVNCCWARVHGAFTKSVRASAASPVAVAG